jgi:large subunit ribosomal protein L17
MRHAKRRFQLNRFTSWHKATIKSLARNIIIDQSIHTTVDRAKAARGLVEKLITMAKINTLASKRRAQAVLGEHKLVVRLFDEIGPRFAKRQGGYTRIISLGKRRGDNAEMVIFELTEIKKKESKKSKKAKNETLDIKSEEVQDKPQVEKPVEESAQKKPEPGFENKKAIKGKPQKKFLSGLKGIFKKERDY